MFKPDYLYSDFHQGRNVKRGNAKIWRKGTLSKRDGLHYRDRKQARTATAVNKQLNFRVKKKPLTTSTYCIFEAYFMIKSL